MNKLMLDNGDLLPEYDIDYSEAKPNHFAAARKQEREAMKPLSETNPYLRDPENRRRLIEREARSSSFFEGARGLPPLSPKPVHSLRAARSKTSTKKPVRGA